MQTTTTTSMTPAEWVTATVAKAAPPDPATLERIYAIMGAA
jgi:hypothetical protein